MQGLEPLTPAGRLRCSCNGGARLPLLPCSPAGAVAATPLLTISLVSADSKIRAYPHLRSLW